MGKPYLTKENAGPIAARGREVWRVKRLELKRLKELNPELYPVKPKQKPNPSPQGLIELNPGKEEAYRLKRLSQVRINVSRLDDMLTKASDPMQVDQISRALQRVSEIERQLAGRPMPGSRKPPPERQGRAGGRFWNPATPQPGPTPTEPPAPPQAELPKPPPTV